MPNVDGLEATQQIQSAWGDTAPPIIALTAAASSEDRARCMAAGMDDYLTKPLQVSQLALALERWVATDVESATPVPTPMSVVQNPAAESSVPHDEGADPAVDFSRLTEFREFDDEEQSMTREVIALFVGDAPTRLAAIRAAVDSQDAPALARAAHALKGACSNVGAVGMLAVCSELEAQAHDGLMPADAAAQLARLEALLPRTCSALEQWLPPLS